MRIHEDPRLDWDGHLLLLHHSERERSSQLTAWVRRGLENDEKVVYAEVDGRSEEGSLLAVLRGNGVDAVAAAAEGRLSVIPPPEFYHPAGGQLPVIERALAEGYRGLRIAAEASTALTYLTWPAYMAIEREIDEITRTHPFSAMCQYEQASTVNDHLSDVVASHLTGIREWLFSTGDGDGELILAGEIDVSNSELLGCALRVATSRAPETLRLNLARVDFLSAGACRAIAEGTRQFRDDSGAVLLVGSAPPIASVLRLSGLAELDGIKLIGSTRAPQRGDRRAGPVDGAPAV
jgi:anti-anti-sigma factor